MGFKICCVELMVRALRDLAKGVFDAEDWFFGEDALLMDDFPDGVTFARVCAILGLDAKEVQRRLLNHRESGYVAVIRSLDRMRSQEES